jgi:hypothetical protein
MRNLARHLLAAACCALIGLLLAQQLNAALGISFSAQVALVADAPPAAEPPAAAEPLPPVAAIVLPGGKPSQQLVSPIAALVAAIQRRTGVAPALVAPEAPAPPGRRIVFDPVVPVSAPSLGRQALVARDSFRIVASDGGQTLTIRASAPMGQVYGGYELARLLRDGIGEAALAALDRAVAPELPYRFVDMGAVGITPDPAAWAGDDYSHTSRAFREVMLPHAPFVDQAALAQAAGEFKAYVDRMIAYGYNGIVVDGFLEYLNFDAVDGGAAIYAADGEHRRRHLALREAFGPLFRYAHEQGMLVVFKTDMLALSGPLRAYFERTLGGVDAENPRLWAVYRQGLAELFTAFPFSDGLMIRIGEAGSVYNLEGWDYTSSLDVTTVAAVQMMLRAFTAEAAAHGKTIIFRSWSVGIGDVGDMHTNPQAYAQVMAGLAAPNLIVSTKYVMGDYYSYLPLNPTLRTGGQQRLVEFQARREYEAFNAFPNALGRLHQAALRQLTEQGAAISGVWVWTQGGGPLRAGPMSLYPFHGFWQTYDDNVYLTGRLAWDVDADLSALTAGWIRQTYSDDPATVSRLAEVLERSHELVAQGLYIGPYARQRVLALGLEPPPMLWIFEWDLVSGANAALSTVYVASRDELADAIGAGFSAVEQVRALEAQVAATDPATFSRPELRERLRAALAYQADLFETLAWYRSAFLSYYRWLDYGDRAAYQQWRSARATFEERRAAHLARYGQDLDFPAYNFDDAEAGLAHAARNDAMTWLARLLLVVITLSLLLGSGPLQRALPAFAGKRGLRLLWLALGDPWRRGAAEPLRRSDWLAVTGWPVALVLLARLAFSSFLSAGYLTVTLVASVLFAGTVLFGSPRPRHGLWAALSATVLVTTGVLVSVLAIRGPGFFWLRFWTDPTFRTGYVTTLVAAWGWGLWVVFTTLRVRYGHTRVGAAGRLGAAVGAVLLGLGALAQVVGLERGLTVLNTELAVLPQGLSKTLGLVTHLDIPAALPRALMLAGAVLLAGGALALRARRAPRRTAAAQG